MDTAEAARGLAEERIEAQRARGRVRIWRAMLFACVVSIPFAIGVLRLLDARLGWQLLTMVGCVIGFEVVVRLATPRSRARAAWDWAAALVEVSAPTVIMLLDVRSEGLAYAITSAPVLFYAPLVLLSALRLRPRLALAASALAAAEFLIVCAVYWDQMPPALASGLPSLRVANVVQRASIILIAGVLSYWVCDGLLELVRDLVATVRLQLRTREAFGRQVAREVADLLLANDRMFSEKTRLTLMFIDIRDFTRFAEGRDPAEVVRLLNQQLERMCGVVTRHGGIVNKFLGDGLLALFGAPAAPLPDHALRAARAALDIVAAEHGGEPAPLRVGVGIHTGEAVVGLMGSQDRSEYTAIGDAVNVASRIEGLNREHGTSVLISDETRRALGEAATTRALGEARVKGREAPILVHELVAIA